MISCLYQSVSPLVGGARFKGQDKTVNAEMVKAFRVGSGVEHPKKPQTLNPYPRSREHDARS